jgi:NADPH-ferrihemoprotein reductase
LAFSREEGKPKVYVQDLMRQEAQTVSTILTEKRGYIYLCGSTRMGQDVQALLKELLGEDGFKLIEKEKRLIKELWG